MLEEKYKKEVIPAMKEKFGYKNNLAVPKIKKAVVNVGIGSFSKDNQGQDLIAKDLALITGQKPVPTLAKKAISAFKVREGMVVGLKVTLRGKRMFDFVSRLINVAIPRTRDFRGLPSKSVDKSGNLTIGIREHIIFPEISTEDIKKIFGMEISIVSNAKSREEALELFKLSGFPIKEEK
ncbi:MAG: 50S ribosomal protein L5 [Candidatus Portnoybacteria bacterium CG10_big_fil_rev_8_21_14_0_10_38_18]|uniref:Large ribosomal subunit protein uL5 n=1 Tax=Candidatus Portnoybacteria bacterium CG10_big_fil_rev_8_21_14_0_10_38_18 TaxID=1974813 RepID=A0A2M8KCF2_9BACT|nr:MAG: 50S ribosomal protein L5 [Candidatus Portnoybacteria bacterium CG10_big_fil_rev_8_21_14_0_10_38_18]